VAAFTALRLTRELHLGEPAFGVLFTIGAGLCLVATLVTGALVERFPLGRVMGLFWIVCAVASVVVGLGDSLVWSIAASLTLSVFWGITSVPGSLWLSRVGGANATTFTVHKIFQAGSMTAGMALVGWLEPIVGMRQLFFIGGLVGLPLALVMWRWRGP
jgi:MFS family permease